MATITSPRSNSPAIPMASPSLPSAVNTPTSSTRHSIELPTPNQAPNNPAVSTQRRNRAALRDYYHLKSKQAAASQPNISTGTTPHLSRTDSITSTSSDATHLSSATLTTDAGNTSLPNTLDDPSFDADAFVANLLKTSSLRDILKTESSLVSEVRNLDGERKALVYDNYSKLIVAMSTIGEMQRGIVEERGRDGEVSGLARMKGLEDKLDRLMGGFGDLVGKKDMSEADARRARIQQRRTRQEEQKQRELVSWVLSAPQRLQDLIDEDKRDEAEKEWEDVQAILDKWQGVKGVHEVRDACNKALEQESDDGE